MNAIGSSLLTEQAVSNKNGHFYYQVGEEKHILGQKIAFGAKALQENGFSQRRMNFSLP
jgi:hypothetical protein